MTVSNTRSVASMKATMKALADAREMLAKRLEEVKELDKETDNDWPTPPLTMSWGADRANELELLEKAVEACEWRSSFMKAWIKDVEGDIARGRP